MPKIVKIEKVTKQSVTAAFERAQVEIIELVDKEFDIMKGIMEQVNPQAVGHLEAGLKTFKTKMCEMSELFQINLEPLKE